MMRINVSIFLVDSSASQSAVSQRKIIGSLDIISFTLPG
uniref:Bm1374 n=1 Tax=Brugia malayi TaxID=6279 RepID=A0A1I9G2Z6_BRUMA|nr:Bm1374 [Brugia malayi]